jgi:RNA polymerase sigma-70 factor (ECF subfamily)
VDDDKLMQQVAQAEETAFRLLVERWQEPVFSLLFSLVGSVSDAQDLSQETFLRVWQQANRYRPEGKFRSWLFRIAGNLARSLLRRRRILRWVPFESSRHDRPDKQLLPDSNLEKKERQAAVRQALLGLPIRQREAVALRRFQDLSYQEIAEVLGTTTSAVESLLQRAAVALRRQLTDKDLLI